MKQFQLSGRFATVHMQNGILARAVTDTLRNSTLPATLYAITLIQN